ncbi:DUF3573 domain-containing protein, partial [Cysteiniphilum sp. SYW-8]|uniref:DUF3573 domain-containing protein n=1 Tax=Cysteiniphilum sp. SYW-8 TaxID=2610890 RepID=UPI00123CA2D9
MQEIKFIGEKVKNDEKMEKGNTGKKSEETKEAKGNRSVQKTQITGSTKRVESAQQPEKTEKNRRALIFYSVLVGCFFPFVGFAENSQDSPSVEAQLAELKAEVALLKADSAKSKESKVSIEEDNESNQNNQNSKGGYYTSVVFEDIDQDAEDDSNITFPTNRGQLQNFLFSNLHEGGLPFGKMNSSQFGLNILQHRNKYSDKALVFGGYLEADGSVWNGSTIVRANRTAKSEKVVNTYQSGKGLYLTTAALYTAANLGRYVTAEMTLLGNENTSPVVSDAFV